MLPGALHLDADSGHTPFSRAGSRNHGAALAMAAGAVVIVVGDADTIPEPGPLHAAIGQAATDGRLHTPYTRFLGLTAHGTRDHLAGRPAPEFGNDLDHGIAQVRVEPCRPHP